jgi:hypothetical protein
MDGLAWCERVQRVRRAAKMQGLQVIFSPRNTFDGIAMLHAGFTETEVAEMNLFAGLKPEQRKALETATPQPQDASGNLDTFAQFVNDKQMVSAIRELRFLVPGLSLDAAKKWTEAYRDGLYDRAEVLANAKNTARISA